jgi:hypothetical protein
MLPQTKILEVRPNLSECVSREALFKGVSSRFGLKVVEKCFPGFRETHSVMLVWPSKILVWDGKSQSQDEDSMLRCLSNSHCDDFMIGPPC